MNEHEPKIIAHRGASGSAPENTIAAFRKAVELSAEMVELDVHLSIDGHLVVIHDSTIDRTTNGSGHVGSMTLTELKKYDAGSWFSPDFEGEQLPTLLEVYKLFDGKMPVNVEVKVVESEDRESHCRSLALQLLDDLSRAGAKKLALISSFDYDLLSVIHAIDGDLPLAYLFDTRPVNLTECMRDGILSALHPSSRSTSPELIKEAKEFGLDVNVWTVNYVDEMIRLANLGVDGLITNYPERWK